MKYSRTYGGIIWTNHALSRLRDRRIPQEIAWKAFRYPEKQKKGGKKNTFEFSKNIDKYTVSVIALQNDRREWVILSSWINPPLAGSIDLQPKARTKNLTEWIIAILKKLLT